MAFDIGPRGAEIAWQEADLPRPTLIIKTPEKGHVHLAYEIATPVYGGGTNQKPMRYLQAIRAAYSNALGADAGIANSLLKTH